MWLSYKSWVLYCSALHIGWAILILFDHSAVGATAVSALYRILGNDILLVIVLLLASISAIAALFLDKMPTNTVLLLPQQSLLFISACGALGAVLASQFADGVVRPWEFIAADQMHIVLASLGHALAIISVGTRSWHG